ncbi:MAG: Secreted protein [Sporanaerobacter sp.]|jgi:hypothetical protein
MFKKFLFIMTIIMALFIISPRKQNDMFISAEDDAIEWNNYKTENISL